MRRLLSNWMSRGSALLALALLLGCTEKPKTEPDAVTTPPVVETPGDIDEPAGDMPEEGAVEDATPGEDAAVEVKEEEEAAGRDPLDTTTEDPNVKLGEPDDPVNLK